MNYYDINVALNGRHFFATAERSCTDRKTMQAVYRELIKRFPETEGFRITVSYLSYHGDFVSDPLEDPPPPPPIPNPPF